MDILKGKRTYISIIVLIVHQITKTAGYDLPNEQLSAAIDIVAGVAAYFFRMIANLKGK